METTESLNSAKFDSNEEISTTTSLNDKLKLIKIKNEPTPE